MPLKYILCFFLCGSLNSLLDISIWEIKNITEMRNMFSGCSSLKSIPDISKWDTKNVTDMYGMFSGCSSLKSIPIFLNGILKMLKSWMICL